MQTILYNISQVIGVAIIHSLWQGLLVYLGLKLIVSSFAGLSPASKHNLVFTALLGLTGWFTYTLLNEINMHTWVIVPIRNEGIVPEAPIVAPISTPAPRVDSTKN